MLRLRRGRIIFISSVVGLLGSAGQVNYAASKAGLVGMARSLARELGSPVDHANVVAPGFVETDMTDVLTDEQKAAIKTQVPLGRYASPAEVASAVHLAGVRRCGIRHRGRHPGRRRTRNGALTSHDHYDDGRQGHRHGNPRRQAHPGRGRDDGLLHRLRDRQGRPGAGRHRAHLQLRPRARHHPAHRQAAAQRAAGARARRHRRGAPRRPGRPGARARRRPRRRRPLDRLRQPRDAARRQVPRRPLGRTSRRPCRSRRTPSSRSPSPAGR